jgi:4-amino-4-deoxy-L-arabinose transferase-like glycosyltransferase
VSGDPERRAEKLASALGTEPWPLLSLLIVIGFGLRLHYLLESRPFFDEFTTMLAVRAILERGLPILPSGLFYEHGLLYSYLAAVPVALVRLALSMARLPSLVVGTLAIPLLYRLGKRMSSRWTGLLAAGILATAPEGVVWGGRARMYALAQALVLLAVCLAYLGASQETERAGRRYRYGALAALFAALFSQMGTIIVIPSLLIGVLVVGWLVQERPSPWFWSRRVIPEAVALAATIFLALLVKRIGQPLGMSPYSPGAEGLLGTLGGLLAVLRMSAGLEPGGESAVNFLARLFGNPHHLPLALLALAGILLLIGWAGPERWQRRNVAWLYLYIVFGLTLAEMVLLLEPWRRNVRYLVMALPLFYLLAAELIARLGELVAGRLAWLRGRAWLAQPAAAIALALFFALFTRPDLGLALRTPEPGYDGAFRYVRGNWQDGDLVLTMNVSACALYVGRCDYFAVQEDAEQFLLTGEQGPVDRWLGIPWLSSAQALAGLLDRSEGRVWFVVDDVRLPVYYRGDFVSELLSRSELVYQDSGALVFLSRAERPAPLVHAGESGATLGGLVKLLDYDWSGERLAPGQELRLLLRWQGLARIAEDYTVFVHLRDGDNATVAQADGQPLGGLYPTSAWRPGEIVPDYRLIRLPEGLPPGEYELRAGMYLLSTLERLPVADDASGENAVVLGKVVIGDE